MTSIEVHTEIKPDIDGDDTINLTIDNRDVTIRDGEKGHYVVLTHRQFHEACEFYNKFQNARGALGAA